MATPADTREEWFECSVSQLIAEYGAVPPPWIFSPRSHPYSQEWRMGAGEGLIRVFGRWWKRQTWSEAERIAYFKRWPPPPRWIPWMADALWRISPWEGGAQGDCPSYYRRVEEAGFEGVAEIEHDFDNDDWRQDLLDVMAGRAPRSSR